MEKKRVAITTLGCKVNQVEGEAVAGLFRRHGYEVVDFNEPADVYVINTCTVTHLGDRKSRQLIRRARRSNPQAVVAVMGCYAQKAPQEVAALGVDVVIGTSGRQRLVELVEEARREKKGIVAVTSPTAEFEELLHIPEGRTRAFIKVQDGCDHFCTYCIVPYVRGPVRSRRPERVVAEARTLIEKGFKEIVLTGIHIGAYGRDFPAGEKIKDLADLMEQLLQIPGRWRLRLSSVEPVDVNFRLVDVMAGSEKVCPHLHLPLQSGDDAILEKMGRGYTTVEFLRLTEYIRSRIPDIALTTDIIVGFPGETEDHFRRTLAFVERVGFSQMHVFKYSPRAGTPAATFPAQVDARRKEERSRILRELGEKLAAHYARRFLGREMEVLFEEPPAPGVGEGLTGNYLRVRVETPDNLAGTFASVVLEEYRDGIVLGRLKNFAAEEERKKERK